MPGMGGLVFTNGCFDLLHPGHVDFLARARALGDRLVVGLNSDASVRAIKGAGRPFLTQDDRASMLRSLRCVDDVVIFDEPTPARLIAELKPDVLVKGGDWAPEEIVGADAVRRHGGRVVSLPLRPGYSTTALSERIGAAGGARAGAGGGETPGGLDECRDAIRAAGGVLGAATRSGARALCVGDGDADGVTRYVAARLTASLHEGRLAGTAVAVSAENLAATLGGPRPTSDVVVALSAGPPSPALTGAVMTARERGCAVIGVTGVGGRRLAALCDYPVVVPGDGAAVIDAQVAVTRVLCDMLGRAT
jgi:rfaE bifunctional protein nucleotidyltransferase chain/domain